MGERTRLVAVVAAALVGFLLAHGRCGAARPKQGGAAKQGAASRAPAPSEFESLRLAIEDLAETFGERYGGGAAYLARLDALEKATNRPAAAVAREFRALQRESLLANPLLDFDRLLVVKRKVRGTGRDALGFPTNHECNSSLKRGGWDNEIAVLSPVGPEGRLQTLYRPKGGGYVGEVDLHWDGRRLLFTQSDAENWKVWEARTDGTGLRQVSRAPADVDCFDACYLPDARIIFGSTAAYQGVPCWHGQHGKFVTNLYAMNADGSGMKQVCFDQDHDFHPVVLNDGQVLYHRWDYTGISHIFLRQLMVMNPDGTGQRAVYGSNSWFPNSLYFPRPIPGRLDSIVSILSGYHGVHRMGRLVVIDTGRGWHTTDGIVHEIPRRGRPIETAIRDNLVDNDWPKFLHPWPLGGPDAPEGAAGKYFLVSCWMNAKALWGIYLVDVFDNMVLVREEPGCALLEPIPLKKRTKSPAVPSRIDPERTDGVVYLHNIYAGPGLAGVPRGTIKRLRVLAYHFGYRGLAGPDKIGYGGPWEVMRILGTVPVDADGSAVFCVPSRTPVAVQALDAEGKAVQLMRSWFTLMPGEYQSCVGCHERVGDVAGAQLAGALKREPLQVEPWYGPARGFDFAREVQPVLDEYCVGCHDGHAQPAGRQKPDLRAEDKVPGYEGRRLSSLGVARMHPAMKEATGGVLKYTPAYEALIPYIRRVSIEDDVSLLVPGEYHADTSSLVQMLRKHHKGVRLDAEAWDRLVTWIDLNAPCHGTWGDVFPVPDGAHQRRMELRRLYGGPEEDPEAVPPTPRKAVAWIKPQPLPKPKVIQVAGWPLGAGEARKRQSAAGGREKTIDLGGGVTMMLARIPAGEFVMGDAAGEPDERPLGHVRIEKPFWMGVCEVTNEQYRRFDPSHDPMYYAKRHGRGDDRGLPLDGPRQPAVRVSWRQALGFCRWLSREAGMPFTLPTEAQWEYACRAGSAEALAYGSLDADFSAWANVGDESFTLGPSSGGTQVTGGLEHMILEAAGLADIRFDDQAKVTAPVGGYQPNAWGLYDMHGNAAEWTRTTYKAYPYRDDGRDDAVPEGRKVVRGGSFFDCPARCRSAFRLAYPAWQRVFNVGFRVVCESAESRLADVGE